MTRIETRSFETVRWLLIAKSSHFLNSAVEGTFLSSINLYTLIQMEAPKKPIPKQSVCKIFLVEYFFLLTLSVYPPGWEQIGVYMFKKYVDEQTTNLLESYRLMVSLHTKVKRIHFQE